MLELENSVLHHRRSEPAGDANASINITHNLFLGMLTDRVGIRETLFSDEVSVDGSALDLLGFFALLDRPDETFNIIEP